ILAALLLHDLKKGGEPWADYDAAHGPPAAKWLGEPWNERSESFDRVRGMVADHMAQWNSPKATPPADLANQIVSYADYIGSQDSIYVTVPESGR
ncbi:MAG: hypothetical protein HY815_10565, partial [Candidatus Riflebacteria bacterium]|nr:hypothetical protein [Candidatus Riflebacteria bacterium]